MDKINVSQSLSQEEFVRFSLMRYFKRPIILIFYSIFVLLSILTFSLNMLDPQTDFPFIYPLFVILLVLPLAVYLSARRIYQSNYAMQAVVRYQFSDDRIKADSEKFDYSQSWDLVYQVEESKNWILLYNNRINAIYLKKESFEDPADLEILKAILKTKAHIKVKLKKNA